MSHRIIVRPHDGKKFVVGSWKRRPSRGPRLALKNYLDHAKLEEVPDCDYSTIANDVNNLQAKLLEVLADVLGNDSLGDCTCAGAVHILAVILAQAGVDPSFITRDLAINLYKLACGYAGTPDTDNGGDELTVLDFLAEKGFDGAGLHQTAGSILVDATNKTELRWAIYNLLNVYYGVGLPAPYVDPFPSGNGFVWGPGTPVPSNGHCFIAYGATAQGTMIDTWGELGTFTYDAQAGLAVPNAGGETHAIITPEIVLAASQKSPTGFSYQDLLSDAKALGMFSS